MNSYIIFIQEVILALCGFFFYFGIGVGMAVVSDRFSGLNVPRALAAMCIITSFVYLADFIFGIINLKNQHIEFNITNITSQVIKIPELVSQNRDFSFRLFSKERIFQTSKFGKWHIRNDFKIYLQHISILPFFRFYRLFA